MHLGPDAKPPDDGKSSVVYRRDRWCSAVGAVPLDDGKSSTAWRNA